jgi:hypothetical protein
MSRHIIVSALCLLSSCATPRSETEIPAPVAIALAGGDAAELPEIAWSSPPVRVDQKWFDRTWSLLIETNGRMVDLTSEASGGTALEARRSDNARAESMFAGFMAALERGMALGMAASGAPRPVPTVAAVPDAATSPSAPAPAIELLPIPAAGADLPIVDALSVEALNRSIAEIMERLRRIEGREP